MCQSNRVLIVVLYAALLACTGPANSSQDGQHGLDGRAEVYYRSFPATSSVNLDAAALKHASDLSFVLNGERAKSFVRKLQALVCKPDFREIPVDLRLLVLYQSSKGSGKWQFTYFFFITPNGKRCRLDSLQRQLLDKAVRQAGASPSTAPRPQSSAIHLNDPNSPSDSP